MEMLAQIVENAQWNYSRQVARAIGGQAHQGACSRSIHTGVIGLDRIYCSELNTDAARSEVLKAMKRYRGARTPFWLIHYDCRGAGDARDWIEPQGLQHLFDWRAMAADLSREIPPQARRPKSFSIERVAGPETLRAASEIVARAFSLHDSTVTAFRNMTNAAKAVGSPFGIVQYIGRIDGKPMGSATMYADDDTVGIYWVGTLAEARRRGVAEALVRHLMERGREAGCRYAALQATPAGQRLYARLGFIDCCPIHVWGWSPESMRNEE